MFFFLTKFSVLSSHKWSDDNLISSAGVTMILVRQVSDLKTKINPKQILGLPPKYC